MCTVVVVAAEDDTLILAGNRDELRTRARALPPVIASVEGVEVLWPRDPDGGGTWTAGTGHGLAMSLLNDYTVSFDPRDPVSRGGVIPALVTSRSLEEVSARLVCEEGLPLERLRAFTLRVAQLGSDGPRALIARWDGTTLDVAPWPLPGLAVSSGLDVPTATRVRARSLAPLLGRRVELDLEAVKACFSDHGGRRGMMSVCMHGLIAHTVSHTQIAIGRRTVRMRYFEGSPCQVSVAARELVIPRAGVA